MLQCTCACNHLACNHLAASCRRLHLLKNLRQTRSSTVLNSLLVATIRRQCCTACLPWRKSLPCHHWRKSLPLLIADLSRKWPGLSSRKWPGNGETSVSGDNSQWKNLGKSGHWRDLCQWTHLEKPLPMRTRLRDPSSCSSTPEAKRQRVHGSEFMGSLALSRAAQQVGSASTSASSAEQPLSSFAP